MNTALDICRDFTRKIMRIIAKSINSVTNGKLSPNAITLAGLFAHLPIAYLIAYGVYLQAALLLIVFGLFDALDGELARLQKRASNAGMVLDASTDRIKEVLLYVGVAYALVASGRPFLSVWAVAACGASLCVSYIKAKGETAISGSSLSPNEKNRLFTDGLLRFEIRMAILILGLLTERIDIAVITIAIGSSLTALGRLARITRKLTNVQN